MVNISPIIFEDIAPDVIARAKSDALEYALLSKPFTFNRMQKPMSECVVNIAKGKFVENLFVSVCRERGLIIDTDSCETPFWQRDRRDFVLMDREWDIKSIFLHRAPKDNLFNDCPALVPNRFASDQWGTRDKKYIPSVSKMPAFVFVFLHQIELGIELDTDQETFIKELCTDHKEQEANQEPFKREWFVERFPRFADLELEIDSEPIIAVTGAASTNQWERFNDQPKGPIFVGKDKVYQTAINNKSCRSGDLPSFAEIVGWV